MTRFANRPWCRRFAGAAAAVLVVSALADASAAASPFRRPTGESTIIGPSTARAAAPALGASSLYLPLVEQDRETERFIGVALRPRTLQTYEHDIVAFEAATGVDFALYHIPAVWSEIEFVELQRLFDIIVEHGATPFIVWAPWAGLHAGVGPTRCQRDYSLDKILAGQFNAYIGRFARAAGEWGHGFLLAFGHEMNIDQAAWSGWCNGGATTGPDRYVRAWRYVHDRFVEQGATNVQWVWSPNYQSLPLEPWNDPERYYPGDAYVDWIGTNGFNWGASSTYTEHRFRGLEEIAGAFLDRMAAAHPAKPQILIEAGSVDGDGGRQARWVADGLAAMARRPSVRAVVYYNYEEPRYLDGRDYDFRLDGDVAAMAALRDGVRAHGYGGRLYEGRTTRPPLRSRGAGVSLGVGLANPYHAAQFDALAGRAHQVVVIFAATSSQPWGVWYALQLIVSYGRTPLVVWDPTDRPLDRIAAGHYDEELANLGAYIARAGGDVLFAWGVEPNNGLGGRSWTGAANGGANGGPERYVAAWRHIHDVFVAAGAANVRWVWMPHYQDTMPGDYYGQFPVWRRPAPDWNHLTRYYPGDAYVDWIGVLAVNNGNDVTAGTYWVPPRTYLERVLTLGRRHYPTTPQLVIVTSVEDGADAARKGRWVKAFYDAIEHQPAVRAVIWQNAFNEQWTIDSSPASLAAYQAAIRSDYFGRRLP